MQTRCEKMCLHMRSSVLFWNWQIPWRATIPGQYFWGLFNRPGFRNSFLVALHPTVSQSFFWVGSSPADIDGPASVAICPTYLVEDNSGDLPTSSNLLASSLLLSSLPRVGGSPQLYVLAWLYGPLPSFWFDVFILLLGSPSS